MSYSVNRAQMTISKLSCDFDVAIGSILKIQDDNIETIDFIVTDIQSSEDNKNWIVYLESR